MAERTELPDLRREITKVTLDIFHLAGKRLDLARRIAGTKARENLPIENLKIEEELKSNVLEVCRTQGISEEFGTEVLSLLLKESKRVQREILESRL